MAKRPLTTPGRALPLKLVGIVMSGLRGSGGGGGSAGRRRRRRGRLPGAGGDRARLGDAVLLVGDDPVLGRRALGELVGGLLVLRADAGDLAPGRAVVVAALDHQLGAGAV